MFLTNRMHQVARGRCCLMLMTSGSTIWFTLTNLRQLSMLNLNKTQRKCCILLTVLLLIYPKLFLSHSISHLQSSKIKRVAGKNDTSKNILLLSTTPFSFNHAIKHCQNDPGLQLSLLNSHFCMQFHYLFFGFFLLIQFFGPAWFRSWT